jgi:hypothetical protein
MKSEISLKPEMKERLHGRVLRHYKRPKTQATVAYHVVQFGIKPAGLLNQNNYVLITG